MRLKIATAVVTLLYLSGCKSELLNPPLSKLSSDQVKDARSAASSVIGKSGRAIFICGESNGLGLFYQDWKSGFSDDGMKDGRLVFLLRQGGQPDVFFRDALGHYVSSIDDGADVRRISAESGNIEMWIVSYKSTGITETHNLTTMPEDGLVNLWTSNKPTSMIGSSAKLFRASCVRA